MYAICHSVTTYFLTDPAISKWQTTRINGCHDISGALHNVIVYFNCKGNPFSFFFLKHWPSLLYLYAIRIANKNNLLFFCMSQVTFRPSVEEKTWIRIVLSSFIVHCVALWSLAYYKLLSLKWVYQVCKKIREE